MTLEVTIQRVGVISIHIDLSEHGEGDSVGEGAELSNFFFRPWFLTAELVARKSENKKPPISEAMKDPLKSGILRGKSALASDVHDEEHLTSILFKGCRRSIDSFDGYFV